MSIESPFPSRPAWARPLVSAFSIALAFAACTIQAHAETGQDYAKQAGARLLGSLAPAIKLTSIDGQVIDLGALRGHKAVYLKFWATWCVPCREQMPHFEKARQARGDDLEVVAINIGFDDTLEQIRAYRQTLGITMPIVRDDDGRLGELFGLRVTPQHVIIGKDGRIQYVGHLADARLDAALASARQSSTHVSTRPVVTTTSQDAPSRKTAATVPAIKVRTLDGDEMPLKDPAGKRRTVLAFLSPWCESYFEKTRPQSSAQCRNLREQLVKLGHDHSVRWVGIASGLWASEKDLRDYRDEHGISVPLTLDRDGSLFRLFGIHRVPAVVVLNETGQIELQIDMDLAEDRSLLDLLPVRDARPANADRRQRSN